MITEKELKEKLEPYYQEQKRANPDAREHQLWLMAAELALQDKVIQPEDIESPAFAKTQQEGKNVHWPPAQKYIERSQESQTALTNIFLSRFIEHAKQERPDASDHERFSYAVSLAESTGFLIKGYCLKCRTFHEQGRFCIRCGWELEFLSESSEPYVNLSESHHSDTSAKLSESDVDRFFSQAKTAKQPHVTFRNLVNTHLGQVGGSVHSKTVNFKINVR